MSSSGEAERCTYRLPSKSGKMVSRRAGMPPFESDSNTGDGPSRGEAPAQHQCRRGAGASLVKCTDYGPMLPSSFGGDWSLHYFPHAPEAWWAWAPVHQALMRWHAPAVADTRGAPVSNVQSGAPLPGRSATSLPSARLTRRRRSKGGTSGWGLARSLTWKESRGVGMGSMGNGLKCPPPLPTLAPCRLTRWDAPEHLGCLPHSPLRDFLGRSFASGWLYYVATV